MKSFCAIVKKKIYKFDKKIEQLSHNNLWEIISLKKSPYIENKDVQAWLCLARICKN